MERLNNYSDIKNYIDCLHKGRTPIAFRKQVSIEEFISDCIVLGLRLNQGISLTRFKERYNFDILEKYKTVIERLTADGYLVLDNDKLRLSRRALFVSNSILSEFI
jgi:oxygen-independent coproporphyrinogen-3 oxidase